jgi:hypothetical protein
VSPTSAASQLSSQKAEQGALIQSYTFASNEGWANIQDRFWSVGAADGAYLITAQPGIGNIWSYRTAAGAGSAYGIGVDMQISGEGAAGLVLNFVDSNTYMAFFVTPGEGTYWLEQNSGAGKRILTEGSSSALKDGAEASNRLVAHLEGDSVRLFINGNQVNDESITATWTNNQYGLVAVAGQTAVEAQFDNLEIRTVE